MRWRTKATAWAAMEVAVAVGAWAAEVEVRRTEAVKAAEVMAPVTEVAEAKVKVMAAVVKIAVGSDGGGES